MGKTAVLTDSTAYLDKQTLEELGIYTIPLSVIFSGKNYREEMDLSTDAFYEKLSTEEALPTTSQPAIGMFTELLQELKDEGYTDVVSVHLSAKISGTLQTALSAGEMVDGITLHGVDSEISCAPQGFLARTAAKLALEGTPPENIVAELEKIKAQIRAYFVVHDLHHLRRGGRLNGAQALIGSMLQIKPILHFEEGLIVPYAKVRTEKKALNHILDMLFDDLTAGNVNEVTVIHANNRAGAMQLKEKIAEQHPTTTIQISYFGPVIGTHLGSGSLGVSWY
ncbi:DegV family protein [Niallia circulans]|uniref:Fatty acid-binding protein DegV n=1 Tax=Shouchella clausii TaxID=79880 RepID=A0A268RVC2_SHOCL|nr:DegV family protein [Shouchella clausii]PAD41080.1 fatty acid-binding protein DegV [Bacillus sp. 7520-S]SPT80939.1 DegV family protein [Niallia circulans]PAD90182.1 fatty acid-binding protein DegV [Shouchella clausii]PAE97087.1 fatty acid-binding protein DegV [Shouchella clausii]PAF12652.1 fatty acid-binding protein DegV [Shouchella clausii]